MGVDEVVCGAIAGAIVGVLVKIMQMSGLGAGMGLEISEGHLWVGSGCWCLGARAQEGDYRDQGIPQQLWVRVCTSSRSGAVALTACTSRWQ